MDEIIKALERKEIKGFLIDNYVESVYQDRLVKFHRQMVIEHVTSYGVVFLNDGVRYASCIRDYVFSHQSDISDLITKSVELIQVMFLLNYKNVETRLAIPLPPSTYNVAFQLPVLALSTPPKH